MTLSTEKLIFYRKKPDNYYSPDPECIQFNFESPDIFGYRDICKTLAIYLGYDIDSIELVFGKSLVTGSLDIMEYNKIK